MAITLLRILLFLFCVSSYRNIRQCESYVWHNFRILYGNGMSWYGWPWLTVSFETLSHVLYIFVLYIFMHYVYLSMICLAPTYGLMTKARKPDSQRLNMLIMWWPSRRKRLMMKRSFPQNIVSCYQIKFLCIWGGFNIRRHSTWKFTAWWQK